METLTGRFLIRKSKTTAGEPILVVVGSAFPNFDLNEISDRDEVWAVKFGIVDVLKFEHTGNGFYGGVDQFIATNPKLDGTTEWKKKA